MITTDCYKDGELVHSFKMKINPEFLLIDNKYDTLVEDSYLGKSIFRNDGTCLMVTIGINSDPITLSTSNED